MQGYNKVQTPSNAMYIGHASLIINIAYNFDTILIHIYNFRYIFDQMKQ